jgi:hypothetical protein
MTYRVEYNGDDIEVATLDAALDNARNAIAADVGPISGFSVEHDETINDWFVQGVRNGAPVGPTAVVSGPEEMVTATPAPAPADEGDGWVQMVTFAGPTAADAFASATAWLAGRAAVVAVTDVGWQPTATGYRLRLYVRDAAASPWATDMRR